MKRIILGLFVGLGLVGCAATNDLINNQYMSTENTESNVVGNWTGNNGPYLVTYKFNSDGTGLTCYSYAGSNSVERFKINDGVLILQTGIKQTLESYTKEKLVLKANYYGGTKFSYQPDPDLKLASPYCERELNK